MCGLNVRFDNNKPVLLKMNEVLGHRGIRQSTHEGTLGHVRLPIQGLSRQYDQPYYHKEWVIVFVGEIFNYKDLRPEAESDIEVVAELWAKEGIRCFDRFDGFWSFAALSNKTGKVHIVTDILAKKPLYYETSTKNTSSEIKALIPDAGPVLDKLYLSAVRKWGYHVGDRTPFENIRKIPPCAHWIMDRYGNVLQRYSWTTLYPKTGIDVRTALETAVRNRLASDVPVSLVLSGGLDSTIIFELMKETGIPFTVYHVPNDETEYLNYLDFPSQVKLVSLDQPEVDLKKILFFNEGPVDLGSMLPQYQLAEAIHKDGGIVTLTGDGADELFGGYRRYKEYDAQYSDIFEEIVYYHLPRLDKLGMAHLVEFRSPFLARDVIEGAMAWPYERRQDKNGLKALFHDLVPDEILDRPKHPLKSKQLLKDPIQWRQYLIDQFKEVASEY